MGSNPALDTFCSLLQYFYLNKICNRRNLLGFPKQSKTTKGRVGKGHGRHGSFFFKSVPCKSKVTTGERYDVAHKIKRATLSTPHLVWCARRNPRLLETLSTLAGYASFCVECKYSSVPLKISIPMTATPVPEAKGRR